MYWYLDTKWHLIISTKDGGNLNSLFNNNVFTFLSKLFIQNKVKNSFVRNSPMVYNNKLSSIIKRQPCWLCMTPTQLLLQVKINGVNEILR